MGVPFPCQSQFTLVYVMELSLETLHCKGLRILTQSEGQLGLAASNIPVLSWFQHPTLRIPKILRRLRWFTKKSTVGIYIDNNNKAISLHVLSFKMGDVSKLDSFDDQGLSLQIDGEYGWVRMRTFVTLPVFRNLFWTKF